MTNETVLLLTPVENYSEHRLAKHIYDYLLVPVRFDKYFYEPLQQIFSRVVLYDYLKRMMEIGVVGMNQEIIELVIKEHPKYVVWNTMYWHGIRESTFELMRKEGSVIAGWFLDDEVGTAGFSNYSKWWIPYIDYFVTNAMTAVPKYRALNAKVIHTIPNTGIAFDRDWSTVEEKYEVSFVGRKYYDREQHIDELRKRNIRVDVFGREWEQGKHISYEEMISIFKTSKINLNFSKVWGDQKQIKGRVFEVCLAGGFILTEYVPGIENYFEVDKEIVCFHSSEEMIDKIIYYLNHDAERRAIARAGWKRATSEHTCYHMFSKVFNEIERDIATQGKKNGSLFQEPKMPIQMRKNFSNYYLNWGMALLKENYTDFWKDTLALSISYNPSNVRARIYYYIGNFFPSFMRSFLFGLFNVLGKLYKIAYSMLRSIPFIVKIKQGLEKKFFRA
ncbi:MAG: glycosyltransferase family 1 protein [Nitrospirae bacterium]|nr:glycosyltransferase family 1 protein [Nitrospirota bacterium]